MSQNLSFWRKVVYVGIITSLLVPLFLLGRPTTTRGPGGVLAQLRAKHNLSQANLGDIDPASESMKLATLGLRGVAANLLWSKANEYKKTEDWDALSATLNQITKLQPNFISVWEFQAHNLSYNVSAEFDNYRHRYHWVKKGISFLQDGVRHNRDNPRLLHQIGWFMGQKFGRADEHVYFRRMFREDKDFHDEINRDVRVDEAVGFDGRPDNWLVGRLWYRRAYEAVEKGTPLKGKSPLVFRADGPMSFVNYAADIEEEGVLGDEALRAWQTARKGWEEFGRVQIPTSWGHSLRLGDLSTVNAEREALGKRIDELTGGLREQIRQEKIAKLSEPERQAVDLKREQLDGSNAQHYFQAQQKTAVAHREVADRTAPEIRQRATALAAKLEDRDTLATRIMNYRNIVNYDYWEIRCTAEATKAMVRAREFLYNGQKAYERTDPDLARKLYEQAWDQWAAVFREYPRLNDDLTADDLKDGLRRYRRLLLQLDQELPEKFPLREMLKRIDEKEPHLAPKPKPTAEIKADTGAKPATTPPATGAKSAPPTAKPAP
jgi:hypothetical protein